VAPRAVRCDESHVYPAFSRWRLPCKVGFAPITDRGTTFLKWLYSKDAPSPSIAEWSARLADYCAKNFPGMSGISFDLENLGLPTRPADSQEIVRRGQRWSEFYGGVAAEFQKRGWMVGAFLKPKVSDTSGTGTFPDPTVGYHLYEMANGHDNLILRPMAYEAEPPYGMIQWFGKICDYAVGPQGSGGKCPPENFQLTLKIASSRNPDQVVVSDGGKVVPELGVVGQSTVQVTCAQVLRPHLTGLCLFPGGAGAFYWSDVNAWLNSSKAAGSTKGWPKHHPLAKDPGDEFQRV
jgi:hypothetical protein